MARLKEDAYELIAEKVYENGWRSVRDLVYMISDDVLESYFPFACEDEEDEA